MSKLTASILGGCFALLIIASLSWFAVGQRRKTDVLLAYVNASDARYVDFLVYRAYRDADVEIARQVISFPTSNIWEQTFEAGSLKAMLDPPTAQIQSAIGEFGPIYNWHKSRAIYRRLHQTNPPLAIQFLDGLERIHVLTHTERAGVESTNLVEPF